MSNDPPHRGEMHPDGDELLYLVSGSVDVVLEEDGREERVELEPGQAFVVPRGLRHRVTLREPSQILYLTPGPGGQYRPLDGGPPRDVSGATSGSAQPSCNQINLVVRDMNASVAFYRLLGLDIPERMIWRTKTGAHPRRLVAAERLRPPPRIRTPTRSAS